MGIVEASEIGFGFEAAGIVRRTGPHVKDLKAGDRVMLMGSCAFSTQVVVSENLCEKIPGGLSFEDASTMPCVFATSIYCIFNVGNLQAGQVCLTPFSFLLVHPLEYGLTTFPVGSYTQCLWWGWSCCHPVGSDDWC